MHLFLGHYMYLEVSGAPAGQTFRFFTPEFGKSNNRDGYCVHFCYHMLGSDMGVLRVYAERRTMGETEIFSKCVYPFFLSFFVYFFKVNLLAANVKTNYLI